MALIASTTQGIWAGVGLTLGNVALGLAVVAEVRRRLRKELD